MLARSMIVAVGVTSLTCKANDGNCTNVVVEQESGMTLLQRARRETSYPWASSSAGLSSMQTIPSQAPIDALTGGCAFVQRRVVKAQIGYVVPSAKFSQFSNPNDSISQNASARTVVEKPPVIPLDLLLPAPSNLTNGTNETLAVSDNSFYTNIEILMGLAIFVAVCSQLFSLIEDLMLPRRFRKKRDQCRRTTTNSPLSYTNTGSYKGNTDDYVLAFPLRGRAGTEVTVRGTRAIIIHWDKQVDGRTLAQRVFRVTEEALLTEEEIFDLFTEDMSTEQYHGVVREVLANLLVGESFGLQAESFRSEDGSQVFLVLRLTDGRNLGRYAMDFQYRMPLSNDAYNAVGYFGPPLNSCGDKVRAHTLFHTEYEKVFLPFRGVDKLRLLRARIDHFLDMEELMSQGVLSDYFVAHDSAEVKNLTEDWGNPWRWYNMSLIVSRRALEDQIRNYFGEEVAWMFVWQRYCMDWLVIPAMIGGAVFFRRFLFSIEIQRKFQIIFAIGMSCWAAVFNNMYARYEERTRQRWGVSDVSPSLHKRHQYDPDMHVLKSHSVRIFGDFLALVFIVLTALGTAHIMKWREQMIKTSDHKSWQNFSALAVTVQILTLDKIWRIISRYLVDLENHKLQIQWQNSWVIKMCVVRIFTNLYPFIYVGLLKQFSYQGCPATEAGCLDELSRNLFFYFVARIIIHFGTDTALRILAKCQEPEKKEEPVVQVLGNEEQESAVRAPGSSADGPTTSAGQLYTSEEHTELSGVDKHYIELQSKLLEYDVAFLMDDWTEQMLTFLFLVCFNVVLPSIAVVALLTTMLEARCMANRNCWYLRRPFPMTSPGIGSWQSVMEVVEIIAVLINVSFAVFTMQPFRSRSISFKFAMFVTVEHLVLLLKLLLKMALPVKASDIEDTNAINEEVLRQTFMHLDEKIRKDFDICTETAPDIGPAAFGGRKDGEGGYLESTVGFMAAVNPFKSQETRFGRRFTSPAAPANAALTNGQRNEKTNKRLRPKRTVTWSVIETSRTSEQPQ